MIFRKREFSGRCNISNVIQQKGVPQIWRKEKISNKDLQSQRISNEFFLKRNFDQMKFLIIRNFVHIL